MARLLVEDAKGVDVAQLYDLVHPVPLNPQEPGNFLIVFGPRQIDLMVCGVVVTANDERLPLLSLQLPMIQNGFVETKLVVQSHLISFAVWKIDVVEDEVTVVVASQSMGTSPTAEKYNAVKSWKPLGIGLFVKILS